MKTRFRELSKYLLLWLVTPLLTSIFLVVGTPLLRVLERVYGQKLYWLTGLIVLALCAVFGVMDLFFIFIAMWICQGVYGWLETQGRAGIGSALVSILAGVGAFFLSLWVLLGEDVKKFSSDAESALTQLMSEMHLEKVQFLGQELSSSMVLQLLPCLIATLVLIGLACSLILDRRMAMLVNLKFNQVVSHMRLMEFRLPTIFLWILLLTALGGLVGQELILKMICLNISAFLFIAYSFQGLAIFEAGLIFFRIGPLIRILLYILVVGNLFFLLSLLGIADFWLDFRKRMKREKKA